MKTLNLPQGLEASELTEVQSDSIGDREQVVQQQSELMKQISLMQQDSKLLDVELENIALQEKKLLERSPDLSTRKPVDVLLEQPVVHRKKRSIEFESKGQGLSDVDVQTESIDLGQQLRRLSVEYQKMMWEVGKQSSMESLPANIQKGAEEGAIDEQDIFVNLLPKGGRINPEMAIEPIAAMRRTISNMREELHAQQLVMQLNFMSNCLDTMESQMQHLRMKKKISIEPSLEEGVCKECKQEIPKE